MKIAFVTPSYFGDLERCKLLTESTTRFSSEGMEHVLIVDRRDMPLFKPLENHVVRLVESESLIPWWIFRVPGLKNWWMSLKSLPVRNWIYQQFLKISAIHATDAEVIQFLDSDVTLTRPFPKEYLFKGDRVRLQRVNFRGPAHEKWIHIASDLLGLESEPVVDHNYIGSFITWYRPNVLDMIKRIEKVAHGSFHRAIANKLHFSEYMTYGLFVDYIKGLDNSSHFYDDSPNLHLCWGHDLSSDKGVDEFLEAMRPEHFGVMIHSKDNIPLERYRDKLYRIWERY